VGSCSTPSAFQVSHLSSSSSSSMSYSWASGALSFPSSGPPSLSKPVGQVKAPIRT
jgi:hypothetical protein